MKTLLTGRWIAFTVASIVAFAVLLGLAQWQWSSAQARRHPAVTTVRPIEEVVTLTGGVPSDGPGQQVSVTGTYDAVRQLRVTGQQVGNQAVDYVLTPIVAGDGVLVPIVRGYVAAGAALPQPPTGAVRVVGALQASQFYSGTGPDLAAISTDNLASRWGTRLRDGYVVLRTTTPSQTGITVLPASGIHVHRALPVWRNIAYAAQWLIFAGFVVFFWIRASRDQLKTKGEAGPDRAIDDDEATESADSFKQGEM